MAGVERAYVLLAALLALPRTCHPASLSGQVFDPIGALVPRAEAELRCTTPPGGTWRTVTDERAVYRFDGVPAGECSLTLRRSGFAALTARFTIPEAADSVHLPPLELAVVALPWCGEAFLDHLILPPAAAARAGLGGIVRLEPGQGQREGPPLARADVRLLCDSKVCGAAKTDANGEFVFADLGPGTYDVQVSARGAYPATQHRLYVRAAWISVWISVYRLRPLERCPQGDCDPKKRRRRPMQPCE